MKRTDHSSGFSPKILPSSTFYSISLASGAFSFINKILPAAHFFHENATMIRNTLADTCKTKVWRFTPRSLQLFVSILTETV